MGKVKVGEVLEVLSNDPSPRDQDLALQPEGGPRVLSARPRRRLQPPLRRRMKESG